jgi:hypothetical protein
MKYAHSSFVVDHPVTFVIFISLVVYLFVCFSFRSMSSHTLEAKGE